MDVRVSTNSGFGVNIQLQFSKNHYTIGVTFRLSLRQSSGRFSDLNDTAKETKY